MELGEFVEEMPLFRVDVGLVCDFEFGEAGVQFFGVADGDIGVDAAVKDDSGRESEGGAGSVGFGETAREFDDGADVGCRVGREREREEGAEREAEQRNAVGVDVGASADVGEAIGDGGEPCRKVIAIDDVVVLGVNGVRAVEVVDDVEGDVAACYKRRDAIGPEGGVAAGAVEQEDGGVRTGSAGLMLVDADEFVAGEEVGHWDWMQATWVSLGEAGVTKRTMGTMCFKYHSVD